MVVCLNPNADDYDESVVRCQFFFLWHVTGLPWATGLVEMLNSVCVVHIL